jgi:hypothetical protein
MLKRYTFVIRIVGLLIACLLILAGILLLRDKSLLWGLVTTILGVLFFVLTALLNEKYPVTMKI